jgi:uncharacterized protein YcbK (DUF882 family)
MIRKFLLIFLILSLQNQIVFCVDFYPSVDLSKMLDTLSDKKNNSAKINVELDDFYTDFKSQISGYNKDSLIKLKNFLRAEFKKNRSQKINEFYNNLLRIVQDKLDEK